MERAAPYNVDSWVTDLFVSVSDGVVHMGTKSAVAVGALEGTEVAAFAIATLNLTVPSALASEFHAPALLFENPSGSFWTLSLHPSLEVRPSVFFWLN